MSYRITNRENSHNLAPARFTDRRDTLFPNDVGVLPLDKTALPRHFKFSALRRLENTQPRPKMTGSTKTEDCRERKLPQRWGREYPRSPEGVRTRSTLDDVGSEISRAPEVEKP